MNLQKLEDPQQEPLILTRCENHVHQPSAIDKLRGIASEKLVRHDIGAVAIAGWIESSSDFVTSNSYKTPGTKIVRYEINGYSGDKTIKSTTPAFVLVSPIGPRDLQEQKNILYHVPVTRRGEIESKKQVFPLSADDAHGKEFIEAYVAFITTGASRFVERQIRFITDFTREPTKAHVQIGWSILQSHVFGLTEIPNLREYPDKTEFAEFGPHTYTRYRTHYLHVDQEQGVHLVSFATTSGTDGVSAVISSKDLKTVVATLYTENAYKTDAELLPISYKFNCADVVNRTNSSEYVVTTRPLYVMQADGTEYVDRNLLRDIYVLQSLN